MGMFSTPAAKRTPENLSKYSQSLEFYSWRDPDQNPDLQSRSTAHFGVVFWIVGRISRVPTFSD